MRLKVCTTRRQKGANEEASLGRHRSETSRSCAAKQAQKESLCLIFSRMSQGDPRRTHALGDLLKDVVARLPSAFFEIPLDGTQPLDPLDNNLDANPYSQPSGLLCLHARRPPEPMIDVAGHHMEIVFARDETQDVEEREGIWPPRERDHAATSREQKALAPAKRRDFRDQLRRRHLARHHHSHLPQTHAVNAPLRTPHLDRGRPPSP